ncbi:MAG: aldo/keto reductase [Prolixibacteraceae bacterium]|jgi:predicted aldo/keto reductase-like oxidoreductase|nr:aldo/keto reductase [Prolixibacteraceae bacterium]
MKKKSSTLNRRDFLRLSAATTFGLSLLHLDSAGVNFLPPPLKRKFGKIDFEVTTLGLGGQASLQWTPEDVDPVEIVLKAVDMGINYFDTSNLYGPSQENIGKAFQKLNLIPGTENYNRRLRESIFLTSKTHIRWAKGGYPEMKNVNNRTNGNHGEGAVADLKRSLSQIFGDGQGNYPNGAYLDMILAHNLNSMEEIDVLYKGLETPLDTNENFGAFVALRDYRDGTNYTGMNPKREKLVKHIGFSGHNNPPVMIEMIQRDEFGILDAMLVAINVNDRKMFNMQHNVIPVATAKNMAVIGMKVFADGAMYDKDARWSRTPSDVVRKVGTKQLPSRPLIEYALTTPGVHTVIIGIGHIDKDPVKCQLIQNFYAAQITPNGMSEQKREEAEELGNLAKEGKTNYFQKEYQGLTAPQDIQIKRVGSTVTLCWAMAYAGQNPVSHYNILKNGEIIYRVDHRPLTSNVKMNYLDSSASAGNTYQIVTVDRKGETKSSEKFTI